MELCSLSGKREVCEELEKRMIDVCCPQEVRWRGQGARMLGVKGRTYKLWWSGKGDEIDVGVMVKEELCGKVVEVRRVSDRVMTVVVVFEEDVQRLICGYATQCERSLEEKQYFYDELKYEWDMHSAGDLAMCLCNLNGHVYKHIDGFDRVHGGYDIGRRNLRGRMLLECCLEKELYMSNTWCKREEKRKVTFKMGKNETDINFVQKNTECLYEK